MRKIIPEAEVEWVPSVADPVGRVFIWNNRLYRAIKSDFVPFYNKLFKENIFRKLTKAGFLLNNSVTPLLLDGYGLVIEHPRIDFPSYPFEWCGEMFKDAAIMMCDLSILLHADQLTLKDAHPYNIMFDGTHPKFIDIGSIISEENSQKWFLSDDFFVDMIFPLRVISSGQSRKVRELLRFELDIKNLRKNFLTLLSPFARISNLLTKFQTNFLNTKETINLYKNMVRNTKLKFSTTAWSEYAKNDSDYFLPFDSQKRWFDKQKSVDLILRKSKPRTVHDIGANVGWYSELAARAGAKVLASDIDEASLNELYKRAKLEKLDIQTALVDFVKSSASNITWPAASDRYKADLVLALALTHHLVFKNHLHFDTISKELANYSNKWLLVEFVPPDDKYIKNWIRKEHDWYTLENFIRSLKKLFMRIEIFASTPYPRKLLYCTK